MGKRIRIDGRLYEAVETDQTTYYGIGIRKTWYDERAVEKVKRVLERHGHDEVPNSDLMKYGDVEWDRMSEAPSDDQGYMEYTHHDFENYVYGDSEDGETLMVGETFVLSVEADSADEADRLFDDIGGNLRRFDVDEGSEIGLSLSYGDGRWIDGEATDCGITATPLDYTTDLW